MSWWQALLFALLAGASGGLAAALTIVIAVSAFARSRLPKGPKS